LEIHDDSVPERCPHCNRILTPWERVLLSVDRALMCKGCWYRILLDAFKNPSSEGKPPLKTGEDQP